MKKIIIGLLVLLSASTGVVIGAEALSVSVSANSPVERGTTANIHTEVSASNELQGAKEDVDVRLKIDGSTVNSTSVVVNRTETKSVTFPYTFENQGERNVTVVANYSNGQTTTTTSNSTTVQVTTPQTTESTPEPSTPAEPTDLEQCMEDAGESLWKSKLCEWKYSDNGFFNFVGELLDFDGGFFDFNF